MKQKFSDQFDAIYDLAVKCAKALDADALLVLLEEPAAWDTLKKRAGATRLLIAADTQEQVEGAAEVGLSTVLLDMAESPVFDKLTQALLESVANDVMVPGADVVAVYSAFEAGKIDTFSYIRLDDHLGRLTSRDLRQLRTRVPLETLKTVVDLAVEIGREGREGKRVGTLFVVGDTRKVLAHSQSIGFDPVRGYNRKERNLHDHRVREGIKEIAVMDGAFVVTPDGTVEAACRYLAVGAANLTLSKGLGARHWAAAAITKTSNALAVTVSETNGTVRLFQNGEVMLRVEPFRRAMKWKDFEYEPPPAASE